jgi:hypothetical protein
MLAIAPFLPWATLGRLSATGVEKIGSEAYVLLVMGLAGLALPLEGLIQRKRMRKWAPLTMGILGGLLTVFYMIAIIEQLETIDIGDPKLGIGAYVAIFGSAMLIAGALAKPKPTPVPSSSSPPTPG